MFYIGYTEPLPHQLHHNVYFSRDFEANLRELFQENRVPSDPSFYTCLSNRTDPADAPAGCENLYVLVPVPNLTGRRRPRRRPARAGDGHPARQVSSASGCSSWRC
jgi:phytoene desaturase